MTDLQGLGALIKTAAKASNVGISGLNTVVVGDVVSITEYKTESTRSDISVTNPLVIFTSATHKQHSASVMSLPSLRVLAPTAPAGFDAPTALLGTQFATGLTQRPEFMFMKEFIDKLDGELDAGKLSLTCVARLNTPSANDATKPAMVASAYEGAFDYYTALGEADGDTSAIMAAREELHKSAVKPEHVAATPATKPEVFVWVPVFRATAA